jgi:ribokinase
MSGRVIVVGAINTDFVISTPHLPTPGETVVGNGLKIFGGGKGANAAVAASRAGANVSLVGAVGDDDTGHQALDSLNRDGVDTSGVEVLTDEPTGAALIVVNEIGENQIALGPGANGVVSPEHVRTTLSRLLPVANIVLVSTEIDYNAVFAAVAAAAAADVLCILNPAPVVSGLVNLLSMRPVLTPNEIELTVLTRDILGVSAQSDDEAISQNLHILCKHSHAPVIATLGSAGCALLLPGGETEYFPNPLTQEVTDTTGAGDTFNGVLAARLATGDALEDAVRTAIIAASLSVCTPGARAGMPDADTISTVKENLKPAFAT